MNNSRIVVLPFPLIVVLISMAVALGMLAAGPEFASGQEVAAPDPNAAADPAAADSDAPDPAAADSGESDTDSPPTPVPGSKEAILEAERIAKAALAESEPETSETETEGDGDKSAEGEASKEVERINFLQLLQDGGKLMYPIAIMSFLVVLFGLERFMGLRRRKVLPPELTNGLTRLAGEPGGFDPRKAYKLCQQYPSAAANVIKTMLMKVGRPQAEVERAVSEADKREADRLYSNVRWLSLAAGVSPLLGLLGTVWGMIQAFHVTAYLPAGANKAEHLAKGIYVALVTTFAGLAVAIPAAILAHWFEGRIQKLFRELDETLLGLMPQLERFEGRLRANKDTLEPMSPSQQSAPKPPPVPPPQAAESHGRHHGASAQTKQAKPTEQQRTPK